MGYYLTEPMTARPAEGASARSSAVRKKKGLGAPFLQAILSTKYCDSDLGLYYYGFRYLSPGLGRWLSKDPIGERGGINRYRMLHNNLPDTWDYLGLSESVAGECNTALKEFIKRNKKWTDRFTFVGEWMGIKENWDPRRINKEADAGNSCLVYMRCVCPCPTGMTDGEAHNIGRTQETTINRQIGLDERSPKFRDFHYRIAISNIEICSTKPGNVSAWEQALAHELQHAKDRCDDREEKTGNKKCSDLYPLDDRLTSPGVDAQFNACECANSLCGEMRAFQITLPGKSYEEIFAELNRRGYLAKKYFCSQASGWENETFLQIINRCNLSEGIIPIEDIVYLGAAR